MNFRIPKASDRIEKGVPLKNILGQEAVECLAHNLSQVHPEFDAESFSELALQDLEPIGIMDRGKRFAELMYEHLPKPYEAAINCILSSLTPPLEDTKDNGLEVFFYLPHITYVAEYGLDPKYNNGIDPFEISIKAQYELTKRFTAEFSIRPFLIEQQDRTLQHLMAWITDPDPHVRRLCSEGTRPRLPWARRIPALIEDPTPALPILEALKDDPVLYVRRSVANHLGDIAKDHPDLVFDICETWLKDASKERKWLIRHAVRHPAKKEHPRALELRKLAKP